MLIPKNTIRTFRKFANALLDRPSRSIASDIAIHATPTGCILKICDSGRSVTCRVTCQVSDEPLAHSVRISPEVLEQIATSTDDVEIGPVESTEHGSRFKITWQTGPVTKFVELDLVSPPAVSDENPVLAKVDPRFLTCLAYAGEVTDTTSTRYSLGCIQLDGRDGTMSATNTNHLVCFDGFVFPWATRAIHIRKSRLFALKDFKDLTSVSVGLQEETLVIASGPWQFTMAVETDARFPNVGQVLPDRHSSTNRVLLDSRDRDALTTCLSQLPGESDDLKPVILDLNGHVAVVGKSEQGTSCVVCLELDRSLHLGPDLRTGIPRKELAYAAKVGADSLFLFGKDRPILACGTGMKYVWMPLANVDLTLDLTQTQCIKTSTVAVSSDRRRAS